MRKVSDVIVDVFVFCGMIGFLVGIVAPVVGLLWVIVEWVL
jgi:hypothetical protein